MNKKYYIKTFDSKSDFQWDNIDIGNIDVNGWNSIPQYVSFFKMVFIKDYGFILKLTTKEKEPWAIYSNDDDPVYMDSCLEAFLLFDKEGYINLETNSNGARIQTIGKDRFNRCSILNIGFEAKIEIKDDEWSIILEIPLQKLKKIYQNLDINCFKKGFSFKGNFYKTGKNPNTNLEHYYMWNMVETSNPDFHQSKYFGELLLS